MRFLGVYLIFLLVLGVLGERLGVTTPTVTYTPPTRPDPGFIDGLTAGLSYIVNILGSMWQLISFQADVPFFLSILMLALSFGALWKFARLIRGGA